MDDGDEPGGPPSSDAPHEGIVFEGLRPPLSLEQRRRRAAVVAIVLVGAMAVLLWPVISYQTFFSAFRSAPAATATGGGFTSRSQFQGGVTILSGTSSGASGTPGSLCPVTPLVTSNGWNELHADVVGDGDVWALLLLGPTSSVNSATLIVWRATGSGAFQVYASGPGNARLLPVNSPDSHPGGSNWQRPGDELQTNFVFPAPGCWQLQVTRGTDLTASIWLNVGA